MSASAMTDKQRAALKVVELAKALVLADNHFLSAAVGRLKMSLTELGCPLATDGFALGVDADKVCAQFKLEKEAPKHDLLHAVFHCVFLHPYVAPSVDERMWSLACDIAAERSVEEVCGPRGGNRGTDIARALQEVSGNIKGALTAEKVYHALMMGRWHDRVREWEALFLSDDHAPWYAWGNAAPARGEGDGQIGDREPDGSGPSTTSADKRAGHGIPDGSQASYDESDRLDGDHQDGQSLPSGDGQPMSAEGPGHGRGAGSASKDVYAGHPGLGLREVARPDYSAEKAGWNRVAKALAVNLQTYSRGRGRSLGALVQDLEESVHDRVDYAEFLRQFAIPGEVLKVSDDEYDYIFYTYGLKLYGNLPLVEPLEYREEKRIREFVIVIDTSGSVYGEIVRRFAEATFDILKSTEAFFERVHVRIIQCDAAVQSDDVITSLEELKEWGEAMRIHGCGGTDFRPAFAYVDKLVGDGEFENLGGLVYFTDGWGEYPDWMPDYKVAFVFYDESYRPEMVPTWAAQIVLDSTTINGHVKKK